MARFDAKKLLMDYDKNAEDALLRDRLPESDTATVEDVIAWAKHADFKDRGSTPTVAFAKGWIK